MYGGREAFFMCMTMSAAQAAEIERDEDASATLRAVCRWRREEPMAFHEILEHVLSTTQGAPEYRASLSPVEETLPTCPPRGTVNRAIRSVMVEWLTVDQIATRSGSTPRTVEEAIKAARHGWIVERRWQPNPATGRRIKAYRITGEKASGRPALSLN